MGDIPAATTLPMFLLELENEENYNNMRCSATLYDADGNALLSKSGSFTKITRTYDEISKEFKLLNILSQTFGESSFEGIEPGKYSLSFHIYEDGQEETGDEYTFAFTLVPYLNSLSISSDGKQILIDPDISDRLNETTKRIVRFNREYSVKTPGTHEINLSLTIETWLKNSYYNDASTGVSLLVEGKSFTAHYTQGDLATTIDATIDFSGCSNDQGVYTVPFSLVYGEGKKLVQNDYTLFVTVGEDDGWRITGYSSNEVYDKGEIATIFVNVEGPNAQNVTYKWQWTELRQNAEDGRFRGDVENEVKSTLTVPTSSSGRRFYRCVVTDNNTGVSQSTGLIVIDVSTGQINQPLILCQPGKEDGARTEYYWGEQVKPIRITAGITDMIPQDTQKWAADISVQWYCNDEPERVNAILLDPENYGFASENVSDIPELPAFSDRIDARIFTYIVPDLLDVGDYYFFCVITATAIDDPDNTASIISDYVKISVNERGELEGFEGSGTDIDPYLIKSFYDLKKIDEYVMGGDALNGALFRFANDITLPADWEPIGDLGSGYAGKFVLPFSGIIDGNGKTLIIEKGGRSLLEIARDAVVKNLFIYGEEINGAGILEKAFVDYGFDGEYQTTDPDIITVENVTLCSGSKTTGSGLVNGGYTSGINNIFIKNCLIEEGVIVGCNKDQSNIGSFVGTLNGRIEDSVSYATVYGVNNVGGLAGMKGQSMGLCEIINCAFLGVVEASGGRVGGIIGAGYISASAPNTPPVTVRNCYVIADIIGNSSAIISIEMGGREHDKGSGIGGILGSEAGLRAAWNNAYICDNYFYGTITDTNPDADTGYDRVGGILGEIGGYNEHLTYENNYYLTNALYQGFGYIQRVNETWDTGVSFICEEAAAFTDGTLLAALNGSNTSYKNWIKGTDGFPVHSDAAYPKELTISGDFKTSYFIGDALDMSGAVFTVIYSDDTETTVTASDIEFKGFDSSAIGIYVVTAVYESVSTDFEVQVLAENPKAITVSFALYGDAVHASNVGPHTLADSNLIEWIPTTVYEIDENTTVLDVFEAALTKTGLTWVNFDGNYISSITKDGVTLTEKQYGTEGDLSGWMYTLNGVHSNLGVNEQFLTDGDCILFHWTDDGGKEDSLVGSAVRSMAITTDALTVKAGEKTGALTVSYTPALLNGNVRAEWSSSDTAIASVDRKGVVTGIAEGTATITATAGDKTATATVTVTPGENVVAVESVTVSPATLTLQVGETGKLTGTILPENATAKDIQWSSDNTAVATVKDGVVTALKAGTAKITAAAGGKSAIATVTVEAPEDIPYVEALKAVQAYLQEQVPNPTVGSTYGEWAVFALNRGGVAKSGWNETYLENLKAHLDQYGGIMTDPEDRNYTEYSRVVLALTAMGVDASQITTDKATYDLVTPLLDKQKNGAYMAEWQGNNGTAFALLALDSHDYLPGAEGRELRAGLIASLKKNRLESGAWSINGTTSNLDVTASVVYALAPYYLDEAKLTALGGTVTYAEVKEMVDGALAYLSAAQAADGGFGSSSPEADVWTLIALASIGRDAATDEAFVKADGSLLDHLLTHFDKATGGFKKDLTSKVDNQMSSEQAAYGLVAYDRFKNNRNTLYDMTDVEIASLEEKANKAAAEEVEELIDAIGEVTLESKAKIDAARAAYDVLTDEQKALVGNLKTLTDAEAAYEELAAKADQDEVDKAAAKGVEDLIEEIGKVTLESEKAIKAARAAYDALTDTQKALVKNLATLEAAEKQLKDMQEAAEVLVAVTFHLRNGSSEEVRDGEEKVYTKGDEGNDLPNASREGYEFQGWFDFPTDGTKYTKVTADLPEDLYAQWKSTSSGGGSSGGSSEGKIKVTFRLIGAEKADKDVDLGAEEYMPDYVTWIATTTYEMDEGDTVYDLWVKATGDAGIRSVGAEQNYVKTVYAPASMDGYALSEFTNGKRSGWMYTINGRHPGYGLKEQELHDGDRIVWHYVNDYSYEVSDWFDEAQYPSLGDGRYYSRWLKAPDRFGGAGGGLGEGAKAKNSGGGSGSSGEVSDLVPSYDGDTVWIPTEVEHSEGGMAYAADAALTKDIVTKGLEKAEDKSRLKLWVDIQDSNRLVLQIKADAMKEIADAGAGLRMACSKGVIELDADDVAKLAESGSEVRLTVSYDDWYNKTRVSVTANHEVADFKYKVELPVTKDGQALSIVNGDGSLTPIKKSAIIGDRAYAEITGAATLEITDIHHYWNDVKENDWFAEAVQFAVSHELMNGVDRYEFAPNAPMTRAMLVTVLYRLEDMPEITGSGSGFGDVDAKSWYAEAVAWASENGLVNGTENGFEPNTNISREQIATILFRYAKYIGLVGQDDAVSGDVSKFEDEESVSPWAQEAMAWAVEVGLFKGDDTNSLNPQGEATRAEVATLLERMIKLIVLS